MFKFEKVEERDMDLVIMRAFATSDSFAALFLHPLGWAGATVVHVEHSLTDSEWGESDITVIVELNGKRYGLLIENKIDADAMPDQCRRYQKRGELGVASGDYTDFAVFITAPQSYLDTNAEAKKYPHQISYETMLSCFEQQNSLFDCEVTRSAIRKKETGYTMLEVPAITDFWRKLYSHVQSSKFAVTMYPAHGPKGSRSTWPQFRIPPQGTALYFKSTQGVVDLEFSGKLDESLRLKSELNSYKEADMHWENTGKSISLRIVVTPIDFKKPFEQYINELDQMLSAVERLSALATTLNDLGFAV